MPAPMAASPSIPNSSCNGRRATARTRCAWRAATAPRIPTATRELDGERVTALSCAHVLDLAVAAADRARRISRSQSGHGVAVRRCAWAAPAKPRRRADLPHSDRHRSCARHRARRLHGDGSRRGDRSDGVARAFRAGADRVGRLRPVLSASAPGARRFADGTSRPRVLVFPHGHGAWRGIDAHPSA